MQKLNEKTVSDPKYRIMELLRKSYGELNVKAGRDQLATHCRLRNKRTVSDWANIQAGSSEGISFHVLDKVLDFFRLTKEDQLYSTAHKSMLKDKPLQNVA